MARHQLCIIIIIIIINIVFLPAETRNSCLSEAASGTTLMGWQTTCLGEARVLNFNGEKKGMT